MLSKFKYASSLLLVLVLAGCQEEAAKSKSAAPMAQKVPVGVVTIEPQTTELIAELPGRTTSSLVAEIRPQVGGIVEKRFFEEGQDVKTGDVLYELDDSTYVSSYKQAQADLESSNASLKSAQLKYDRYKELRKQNNVSQQDLDDAQVAFLEAKAKQKGSEAALESTKINLGYTKIRAPIDGRIGISQVTVGALVTGSQSTVMTTIRSLDPIFVDLAQTSLDQLKQRTLLKQDGVEKGTNKVSLILEDGTQYEYEGQLKAREVSVDENTGSVTLRAEFPNPDDLLLPGMFVRGLIHEATHTQALLVPQQGVFRDVKGNPIAYLVNDQNIIEKRILTVERAIGNQWLVLSGINAGDKVVVEGSMKIRSGSEVMASPMVFDKKTGEIVDSKQASAAQGN
ncbi:efflux RND transporter periplasmic adaptor subunit [Marinomonas posidonica]|uniref:Efflux transporter, RND family, MFP subunit n=1 Tax=Marinomonas posidonica (strain CECT 7376 / NCIMB 14433 / IVIA-Po-181) TaxID=491952 RepID=F6D073_MARPP|nr:efflux RND transporter periplasmic adaptor subunit [Marinomonas posidonica]AEF55897.1 efflux transporter, RND family, MFP subunit [Marinomonas posidonica IVIA-Po-181]